MTPADPDPPSVRVFILDDHDVVRWGLHALLTRGGLEVVGESGSAVEAVTQIERLQPDVAILDVRLPDGSGVEVCRQAREVAPSTRVLLLTSFREDREALFEAIEAGASGYMIKDVNHFEIVEAVRRIADGQSVIDTGLTGTVLDRVREPVESRNGPGHLSRVELTVLRHISDGLTNKEIAHRMQLGDRAVRGHVSSVLAKLGVRSRTQAAVAAREILEPPGT